MTRSEFFEFSTKIKLSKYPSKTIALISNLSGPLKIRDADLISGGYGAQNGLRHHRPDGAPFATALLFL